jgi:hypothetical protein
MVLPTMQRLPRKHRRPEIILRGHYLPTTTFDFGSSGFISDSDGEVELLPPEELEVLTASHERVRNELQAMREAKPRGRLD